MKHIFIGLLFLATNVYADYNWKIDKVIDGDTVRLEVDYLPVELGNKMSLRILGIDTPELHGKCLEEIKKAQDARDFLKGYLKGKQYTIVLKGRDKYFRLLGDIKVGNELVSEVMLKNGHAVVYQGKTKTSWCKI
jgi:endonuclease YncB( thermonuclease family)